MCHKSSLKTETLPGHIQLACSGDVLALPHARNAVALWNLADESAEVCLLFFHHVKVTWASLYSVLLYTITYY